MTRALTVRLLEPADIDACECILRDLPDWFGIEASNVQYIADLHTLPTIVATVDGEIAGFLTLKRHNPSASEIHCLAVERALHRHGIGRALVTEAERILIANGTRLVQVKTLGPSHPDSFYAQTREFYAAMGFLPLDESTAFWGEENPALIMVKALNKGELPS